MPLSGIVLRLSAVQLSDLFFNFDHPARDRLYRRNDKEPLDHNELHAAVRSDAAEFAAVIGIDEDERADFVERLAADFERRV